MCCIDVSASCANTYTLFMLLLIMMLFTNENTLLLRIKILKEKSYNVAGQLILLSSAVVLSLDQLREHKGKLIFPVLIN